MIIVNLETKMINAMDNTHKLVEQTAQEIVHSVIGQVGIEGRDNKEEIQSIVENKMDNIRKELSNIMDNATEFTEIMDHFYAPHTKSSEIERRIFVYVPEHEFNILRLIDKINRPMTQMEISYNLSEDSRLISYAMRSLLHKGLVFNDDEGGAVVWGLTKKGFGILRAKTKEGDS
jgi:predicted transcriptional regulator